MRRFVRPRTRELLAILIATSLASACRFGFEPTVGLDSTTAGGLAATVAQGSSPTQATGTGGTFAVRLTTGGGGVFVSQSSAAGSGGDALGTTSSSRTHGAGTGNVSVVVPAGGTMAGAAGVGGDEAVSGVGGTLAATGATLSLGGVTGNSATLHAGGTSTSSEATSGSGGGARVPYCNALPHLTSVPVLDGVVDGNLSLEPVVPVGWTTWGSPLPKGLALSYAAAWHDTGFYFFIEVVDAELNPAPTTSPVWQGDAVEIYVDHDAVFAPPNSFDPIGTRQFVVGAPANASSNSMRGDIFVASGIERSWPITQWKGTAADKGYMVEAFVAGDDLMLPDLQLNAGQVMAFDLGHDVSYPIGQTGMWGNRLGQYFLKVKQPFTGSGNDFPFIDTSVFCKATLLSP